MSANRCRTEHHRASEGYRKPYNTVDVVISEVGRGKVLPIHRIQGATGTFLLVQVHVLPSVLIIIVESRLETIRISRQGYRISARKAHLP